jgi:F0F1-type ATP synthase assembly protein I
LVEKFWPRKQDSKQNYPVWLTAFWLVSTIQQVPNVQEELALKNNQEETNQSYSWQERVWVLAVAGQAGLYIAFPVLAGMVIGYFLDRLFNTYILFAALLSLAGFGAGIFLVYRWVQTTVKDRLDKMKKEE